MRWIEGKRIAQLVKKRERLIRFAEHTKRGYCLDVAVIPVYTHLYLSKSLSLSLVPRIVYYASQLNDVIRKDAVGPEVAVGAKSGAADDPITNTSDKPYLGEPDDPPIQMWYYREAPPQNTMRLENLMITLTSALLWGWFVYHLYYNYGELIGEYYIPAPEEFSDEELGIPPDNAPDPEYWGDHPLSRVSNCNSKVLSKKRDRVTMRDRIDAWAVHRIEW
ncbi:putative NADH dehydrogenase [ubiquinone] 1 beta subcomplex subunit 2 [Dirofilaria immitis]